MFELRFVLLSFLQSYVENTLLYMKCLGHQDISAGEGFINVVNAGTIYYMLIIYKQGKAGQDYLYSLFQTQRQLKVLYFSREANHSKAKKNSSVLSLTLKGSRVGKRLTSSESLYSSSLYSCGKK